MASVASNHGSVSRRSAAWQSSLSGEMQPSQLVIPRAKMKPRGYQGYGSDDDRLSAEVRAKKLWQITANASFSHVPISGQPRSLRAQLHG